MKLKLGLSIWILLGLALVLRLPLLGGSFWLDEAAQALESARPLAQQFEIIPDFQPPLIHLLVHFALYFGRSEWWLRTVAALIPGLISIWATYQIGKRLGLEKVGWWAALLLTTSSFHIFYSQELRPYALPLMFGVLSWWYLLADQAGSWKRVNFIGFTLCTIAGLYSSYLYPFLVLGQLAWVGVQHWSRLRSLVVAGILSTLAFLPWLPIFFRQLAAGGEVRRDLPGWEAVVSVPQLKSLPLVFGKFIYGVVDLELNFFFIVTSLALVSFGGVSLFQLWRSRQKSNSISKPFWFFMIWLVVPLLTSWIISFWIPVVQPKRVLYLLPVFYLLVTYLALQLKNKTMGYLFLGLLLALNCWGTLNYYLRPVYQREDWRQLQQEITTEYPESAVALFSFPEPFAPWRWYDDGNYPTASTGVLSVAQVSDLTQFAKSVTKYQYVVSFDYLLDLSDPRRQLEAELLAFGYQVIELKSYPNIGFVRIYAKPGATLSVRE